MSPQAQRPARAELFAACPVPNGDIVPEIFGISPKV